MCCQAHLQGQKAGAAAAHDVPELPGQAATQLGHQIALYAGSPRLCGLCVGGQSPVRVELHTCTSLFPAQAVTELGHEVLPHDGRTRLQGLCASQEDASSSELHACTRDAQIGIYCYRAT